MTYRPGLYPIRLVRKHALRVMLVQVAICQTGRLVKHLSRLPTIEVSLLVSELLLCMPTIWQVWSSNDLLISSSLTSMIIPLNRLPPNTKWESAHRDLTDTYIEHLPNEKLTHSASSLLRFILALSEAGLSRAVLDSGFLDVLLYIYASNFVAWPTQNNEEIGPYLLDLGQDLLLSLSRSQEKELDTLHPIYGLWPKDSRLVKDIYEDNVSDREDTWRDLGVLTTKRLHALEVLRCITRDNSPLKGKAGNSEEDPSEFTEFSDASSDVLKFFRFVFI